MKNGHLRRRNYAGLTEKGEEMSDWEKALFGVRVGDEVMEGQTAFAVINAVPLPDWPEKMDPELLNHAIHAATVAHQARLMVTEDCLVYEVDDSTTRVLKSALLEYVPPPFSKPVQVIADFVDSDDYEVSWHRASIPEVGSFRYDYPVKSFWGGEKTIPLYYHGIRDHAGYWYLYLQGKTGDLEDKATYFATALQGLGP